MEHTNTEHTCNPHTLTIHALTHKHTQHNTHTHTIFVILCSYKKPRAEDVAMPTKFGYQCIVQDLEEQKKYDPSPHINRGRGQQ